MGKGVETFEVLKSEDGGNFSKVGIVHARGDTLSGNKNYQFLDLSPFEGSNHYMLKS